MSCKKICQNIIPLRWKNNIFKGSEVVMDTKCDNLTAECCLGQQDEVNNCVGSMVISLVCISMYCCLDMFRGGKVCILCVY